MCGIGLTLFRDNDGDDCDGAPSSPSLSSSSCRPSVQRRIHEVLANRGPDLTHQHLHVVPHPHLDLTLLASVLHMRGGEMTAQPLALDEDDGGDSFVLCWNGEVYSYDFSEQMGMELPLPSYDAAEEDVSTPCRSDTRDVMTILSTTIKSTSDGRCYMDRLADAMSHVHGEYAFILYHRHGTSGDGRVFFGRDPLGRRSLLTSPPPDDDDPSANSVVISSASFEGDGVSRPPMVEVEAGRLYQLDLSSSKKGLCTWSSVAMPRPVASASAIPPHIFHDASYASNLATEANISESMVRASETLHALLDRAVRRRVINAPKSKSSDDSDSASVAVLFSGGLDSVVLAALAHNHVPADRPIDLINVAFFSSEVSVSSSPDRLAALLSFEEMEKRWPHRRWRFVAVDVPYREVVDNEDRIARLMSPSCSTMDFNIATAFWFLGRGVGRELRPGTEDGRPTPVDDRDHSWPKDGGPSRAGEPLLRFASLNGERPDPKIRAAPSTGADSATYESKARILLIGIGADEQLGGYGRHRSVYNHGGYEALRAELEMDRDRLWTRNLGRDDRVLSDHGREARFPFLDEDVVNYIRSLDVVDLCDMDRPGGEGDKMILRLIAKKIGVERCSGLVKRAIQFGSRIAKCSDVDRFGSSRRASGRSEHKQSGSGGGPRDVNAG